MKTVKITLLFISVFFLHSFSYAQSKVTYAYDAAGNRISRTIVIQAQLRAAEEEVEKEETEIEEEVEEIEEPTIYSEVLSELLIKIYPNPTQGLLHIEIENLPPDVTARIALYQLTGKLITARENITSSTEIDITGQVPGVYILKIVAGENQTEWRIIKK